MQTIEINKGISVNFEDLLKGIQHLDNQSLVQFANEINRLVSKRTTQQSDKKEAELLKRIKTSIPASMKRRQKQLYNKMQDSSLSVAEKEELVLLNNMIEEKTAHRIALMGELANLRQITLQELYSELNTKIEYE